MWFWNSESVPSCGYSAWDWNSRPLCKSIDTRLLCYSLPYIRSIDPYTLLDDIEALYWQYLATARHENGLDYPYRNTAVLFGYTTGDTLWKVHKCLHFIRNHQVHEKDSKWFPWKFRVDTNPLNIWAVDAFMNGFKSLRRTFLCGNDGKHKFFTGANEVESDDYGDEIHCPPGYAACRGSAH